MRVLKQLYKVFMPTETMILGRWKVRHQHNECEYYIHNLHCDPGYSVSILEYKREQLKSQETPVSDKD